MTIISTTAGGASPSEYGPHERMKQAWQWLEAQRNSAPDGADIWHIRHQAGTDASYLTRLIGTLQAGEYRLSPMQLHGEGDNRMAMWGVQDALVLKWVALSIRGLLPLHPACEHVKGHGGGKRSIQRLHGLLTSAESETAGTDAAAITDTTMQKKTSGYCRVCRTDIRGYYRNINRDILYAQVKRHVGDPVLLNLVHQYLHYTVEDGGTFHTPEKGISRGCALSPLMGALHLYDMDAHFSAQKDIHYARYMDDVIILAKTRWSLRRHTKRLMQWLTEYGFEAHPDKTQIGKTEKGFDWMGAWLTHEGVTDIAPRAKANHREKVRRLYEQLARVPNWLRHRRQRQVHARVSTYRKRWNIWAGALLMLSTVPGVTRAAGSIVVLSGASPVGYLPTMGYRTTGTMSGVLGSSAVPAGGATFCISFRYGQCGTYGAELAGRGSPTHPTPPGMSEMFAYRGPNTGDLYLGVAGTITSSRKLSTGSTCSYAFDGTTGWSGTSGCGAAQLNSTSYWTANSGGLGGATFDASYARTTSYDISLRPYNAGVLVPGVVMAGHTTYINDISSSGPYSKAGILTTPTYLIISGLQCTLMANGPISTGAVNLGATPSSTVPDGQPAAQSVSLGSVSSTCTGVNPADSSANFSIGLSLSGSGATVVKNGFEIHPPADPGHYIVISDSSLATGATACQGHGALSTTSPLKLDSYTSGQPGRTGPPVALAATLCGTGIAPDVGPQSATVTVSWVTY